MTKSTFTALSTTIASSIRSLSLALLLSSAVSYAAHSEGEDSVCIDANGQRQACIQIVGKPKRLTQCQDEAARKNAPECQGMNANSERYELSIKATQADGQIINNLEQSNLSIKINGKLLKPSITSANVTAPLRVIVLLDYSGSMEALDAKANRKLVGAVNGIRTFIQKLQKNPDVKLAVMPFAVPDKKACRAFPVTDKMLFANNPKNQELLNLNNFYAPNAAVLSTYLETLGNVDNLCLDTATNLYDALALSLEFLGDRTNKEFYPPIPQNAKVSKGIEIQQPNLFIVMLSDGFNTVPFEASQSDLCSSAHLDKFTKEYLKNPKYAGIKIFTLGYGKTPDQLSAIYKLTERAACKHTSDKGNNPKYPIPGREFLDEDTLRAIAKATGGFSDMSGDADKIAEIFTKIRNAIGGEYKLTYTLDRTERAEAYEVAVTALFDGKPLTATQKNTIGTFAFEILPFGDRLKLWVTVLLVAGVFGGIPFFIWAKRLRKRG